MKILNWCNFNGFNDTMQGKWKLKLKLKFHYNLTVG